MAGYTRITAVAVMTGIGVSLAAIWLLYRHWHVTPLPINAASVIINVEPGESVSELAQRLYFRGIIDHELDLTLLARLRGVAGRVRAGEYEIGTGTTVAEMLEQFVSGEVMQHALTIIEGMTFREVMNVVNAHAALTHSLRETPPTEIMRAITGTDKHPEGWFAPDTYHFPRGTKDTAFLKRAHDRQLRQLEQEWENRADNLPLETPYEALILASIIEKETSLEEERQRIAGVFIRRLRKNMRLQTDPTVIYGIGEEFDGDIRFADLQRDTPYNSYTRHGLPPTPIAMPGRASINAALHPAEGKELYFVATGEGGHYFSETLEEHNDAVRRYQLKRNR